MEELTGQDLYRFRNAVYNPDRTEALALLAENPAILEVRSGIGETVLHVVAVENEQEVIAWLLAHGANIDTVNDFGETPLMDAACLEYTDLCRFLLANGANASFVSASGNSALSQAARKNNLPLVQLFLTQLSPQEDI
ncbi:MAG: ankyrin repeat domain-containing protein, partial [Armatimonadetes bacterium]|nr:ankyrin repeat domain-containing protein [Armatimonadota bacterium]